MCLWGLHLELISNSQSLMSLSCLPGSLPCIQRGGKEILQRKALTGIDINIDIPVDSSTKAGLGPAIMAVTGIILWGGVNLGWVPCKTLVNMGLSHLWLYRFEDWCIHQGDLALKLQERNPHYLSICRK